MSQTKAQLISDLVQALNFTGTASAPANGAFLSATNTLALATNSAQRLTIDSSGQVGIGTTSPVGRLHVHNAGTGSGDHAYAFFTTGDTGSSSSDGLTVGVAATQVAFINFREANDLVISTTSTERMRIKANGNVGINNTNPDRKLEVQNDGDYAAKFSGGSGAGHTSIEIGQVATNGSAGFNATGGSMLFDIAGAEKMRLNTSGQLGIGTSSPAENLHINSASGSARIRMTSADGSDNMIVFGDQSDNATGAIKFDHSDNSLGLFGFNNTERMRIDSSGNVGINQTPTRELSLHSPNNNNALIHFTNDDTGETSADGILVGLDGNENMVINNQETGKTINFYNGGSERVRIDSDGRLQIGSTNNSSTGTKLVVGSGNNIAATALINTQDTDIKALQLSNWDGNATTHKVMIGFDNSGHGGFDIGMPAQSADFAFQASGGERMRITGAGNVGIGLTNPDQLLHIYQQSGSSQAYLHVQNNRSRNAAIQFTTTQGSWLVGQGIGNDNDRFAIYDTVERFVLNSSGNVGIATASPGERLDVNGTTKTGRLLVNTTAHHNSSRVNILGHSTGSHTCFRCADANGNQLFKVRNDGAVEVDGSLSKGSGSFLIEHPLPSLAATKTLRHSFIEGPQCDNIYRGKVTLSSGTASINLDTVSKMTEGTFVVLNRDVQCFTSNETGWNAVKGSVTGNILTITCENNSSTDTISWMVVGERQDPNIKASIITDDDGYLLVEEDKVAALEAA